MRKQLLTSAMLCLFSIVIFAQPKADYYDTAIDKKDAELKTALYNIIKGHVDKGYDFLYTIYKTSDNTADGKVWDMYSTCVWEHGNKQCGNYTIVGDCYNREHSIPQSWFSKARPMVSDAFHVYPTDGKVNGQRGNNPYGECQNGSVLPSNSRGAPLGRSGSSTFPGYSGTVFEPVDEYKGDFARTYFYMATRYQDKCNSWGNGTFSSKNLGLSDYAVNLFIKWHLQDPVSEKETNRNNAVEKHQRNRNPFIDYPKLAEHIWGNLKGVAWNPTASGVDEIMIEYLIAQNPVQNELTINTSEPTLTYTIYYINGQMMLTGTLNGSGTVQVNDLDNGLYLIQMQSGSKKAVQKFIVNK